MQVKQSQYKGCNTQHRYFSQSHAQGIQADTPLQDDQKGVAASLKLENWSAHGRRKQKQLCIFDLRKRKKRAQKK